MKLFNLLFTVFAITLALQLIVQTPKSRTVTMTSTSLQDKIKGGWAGQT